MDTNHTFTQNNENKQNVSTQSNNKDTSKNDLKLTINDIRNIAILKYGGVNAWGRSISITSSMASRLLSGQYIPLKPETIHKIADSLGVDPVTLRDIYTNCKNKSEECGNQQVPCNSNSKLNGVCDNGEIKWSV